MKLSDALTNVGRPVAYYPNLAKALGSVKAGILCCQLFYWTDKTKNGWLYKTASELEDETGLSYKEQRAARRRLVELGILKERNARLQHRQYFRLDLDAMNRVFTEWLEADAQRVIPELPKGHFGECPKGSSGTDQTAARQLPEGQFVNRTENTTETNSQENMAIKNKEIKGGGAAAVHSFYEKCSHQCEKGKQEQKASPCSLTGFVQPEHVEAVAESGSGMGSHSAPLPAPLGLNYWQKRVGTPDGLVEFFHGYIKFKYPNAVIRTNYGFDVDNANKCLELLEVCQSNDDTSLVFNWVAWFVDTNVDPRNNKSMTLTSLKNSWYDYRRLWETSVYRDVIPLARFIGLPDEAESTPTSTTTQS